MCGQDARQSAIFSTVSLEERIPADHPLRAIRSIPIRLGRHTKTVVGVVAINGRA